MFYQVINTISLILNIDLYILIQIPEIGYDDDLSDSSTYLNCLGYDYSMDFSIKAFSSTSFTLEMCYTYCISNNYYYFGVQSG